MRNSWPSPSISSTASGPVTLLKQECLQLVFLNSLFFLCKLYTPPVGPRTALFPALNLALIGSQKVCYVMLELLFPTTLEMHLFLSPWQAQRPWKIGRHYGEGLQGFHGARVQASRCGRIQVRRRPSKEATLTREHITFLQHLANDL